MSIVRLLLIPALGLGIATGASASEELLKASGCTGCHAVDSKRLGPPLREVAARYKGQADAPEKLFAKVRAGGAGNWGQVPMMANGEDRVSDEDLKTLIAWILDGAK